MKHDIKLHFIPIIKITFCEKKYIERTLIQYYDMPSLYSNKVCIA